MRGVYRDSTTVTIEDDLTIHGFADRDVILSGADCIDSASSAATALTVNIASSEVVVLENLDFRNYTTAIDLTGSTGGTLIIRNCNFLDNTTHMRDDGGGAEIRVIDSTFVGGSYGIRDANGLTVVNSTFDGQSTNAIEGTFAQDWRLVSSRISNCGGVSISAQGGGTGTHGLELADSFIVDGGDSGIDIDGVKVTFSMNRSTVSGNAGDGVHLEAQTGSVLTFTDSNIESNDDDGIFIQNTLGCTDLANLASAAVMHSRINANGDDGIDIGGTGTGCGVGTITAPVECGLLNNSIVGNGDFGIVETSSSSTFHCDVGVNMISYNVSGAESGTGGTPVCSAPATATPLNQTN